jgi:hypothetical protein
LVPAVAAAAVHPEVMTLVTLADVRELIERRLPANFRDKATWRVDAGGGRWRFAGRKGGLPGGAP